MKILVTGGNGMVGKHLKDIMPNAHYLSSSEVDLRDYNNTFNFFNLYQPDAVIHLAAKVGGIKANMQYPVDYLEDNLLINTNTLKASYLNGVKRFIGILSTCAYPDKVEHYPLTEEDLHSGPPALSNLGYGYAKRCLAVQIDAYNEQYDTKYQYLIPSNLYSEYDDKVLNESHFVNSLVNKIFQAKLNGRDQINLLGTGKSLRQVTYALDLAKIIKLVLEKDITESFNVSNPHNYSIYQLVIMALDELRITDLYTTWDFDHKLDGQYRKDVSISKMTKYIGNDFNFTSFREGIKIIHDSISKRYNR
jgi:GDP-L-fucose synthase